MVDINERTKERLLKFSKSPEFDNLSLATQERLGSFLDTEEQEEVKTPVTELADLFRTPEGLAKLSQGATSPAMSVGSATALGEVAMKVGGAFGQAIEAPIATAVNKLQHMPTDAPIETLTNKKKRKDFLKYLKGFATEPSTSPKYYGDVFKEAGADESLSATLGFLTSVALDPTLIQQTLVKNAVKGAGNIMQKAGRQIKLLKMASPVEDLAVKKAAIEGQFAKKINQTTDKVKRISSELSERMAKSSYDTALEFQTELPKFFRENSTEYGRQLFEISNSIPKGSQVTLGQVSDLFEETLQNMAEQNAMNGGVAASIKSFAKKYGIDFVEKATDGTIEIISKDPNKIVPFHAIVKDVRKLGTKLSSGVKSGKGRWTDADRAYAIFKNNFGEIVTDKVPEFGALQAQYREVIHLMNDANRIFVPGRADTLSTKSAENFLKRVAEGKANYSEQAFLNKLEEGIGDFKGVGRMTNRLKRISKRTKNVKEFGQQLVDLAKVEQQKALDNEALIAKNAMELWNKAKKTKLFVKRGGAIGTTILLYELLQRPIRKALSKIDG